MGSRGSVIPFFLSLKNKEPFPITDERMTRFMITLDEGVRLVWKAFEDAKGGEIYVKKIPSMNIMDIAKAVDPSCSVDIVGIRPGEKLHEQMISTEDAATTYEYDGHYKILPAIHRWDEDVNRIGTGRKVDAGFQYASDSNSEWMDSKELTIWIKNNKDKIGYL